jgi:hypothetical protein
MLKTWPNLTMERTTWSSSRTDFITFRGLLWVLEMRRVARRAVVLIEPHDSLVARLIGTTWEADGEAVNYVFRWTRQGFTSVVRSYLGKDAVVAVTRFWDHAGAVHRAVLLFPEALRLVVARLVYAILRPANRAAGNMMVGVVVKNDSA